MKQSEEQSERLEKLLDEVFQHQADKDTEERIRAGVMSRIQSETSWFSQMKWVAAASIVLALNVMVFTSPDQGSEEMAETTEESVGSFIAQEYNLSYLSE